MWVVAVVGMCEICEGMFAEKPGLFRGFSITRIDDNTINISLNKSTLRMTPDIFGSIFLRKRNIIEENSIVRQIEQKGKLADLECDEMHYVPINRTGQSSQQLVMRLRQNVLRANSPLEVGQIYCNRNNQ